MLGFLVKKAFFDSWDSMFRVLLLNLGFYLPAALFVYAPAVIPSPLPILLLRAVALAAFFVYAGGASAVASAIVDYRSPDFAVFWQGILDTYPTSLLVAAATGAYILFLTVAFGVYATIDQQLFGFLAQLILAWITVGAALAAQLFFPMQSRLERNPRKMLRKLVLLFFDNTAFLLVLAAGAVGLLAVSTFTGGLLPGIGAILLWYNAAFKLRLYKYDYLEAHPEADRRRIPWDALLIDDRERVGERTLRGMIFPWKE